MPLLAADSSAIGRALTIDASQVAFDTPHAAGSNSFLVGAYQRGTVLGTDNSGLYDAGTGDFTAEGYVWPTANAGCLLLLLGGVSWRVRFVSGTMRLNDGGSDVIVGSTVLTVGALHYWALTRSGSTVTLWLDGVSQGTVTRSSALTSLYVRFAGDNVVANLPGWYSELRYTLACRYTGTFTPPYAAWPTGSGDASWSAVRLLLRGDSLAAPATALAAPGLLVYRYLIGGSGRIVGSVALKGTPSNLPVRRRVRLVREADGLCIAEQWSDAATGAYAFTGIDRGATYTVIAYDGPRIFRATVADGVTPDAMP